MEGSPDFQAARCWATQIAVVILEHHNPTQPINLPFLLALRCKSECSTVQPAASPMSRLVREFLRRPSCARFISTSIHQKSSTLVPPLCLRSPDFIKKQQPPYELDTSPNNKDSTAAEELCHPNYWPLYPSFSLGHFLNSTSLSGSDQSWITEADKFQVEEDRPDMLWADSVKKKRKKKMNKHKLKKLRKSLRRKT